MTTLYKHDDGSMTIEGTQAEISEGLRNTLLICAKQGEQLAALRRELAEARAEAGRLREALLNHLSDARTYAKEGSKSWAVDSIDAAIAALATPADDASGEPPA